MKKIFSSKNQEVSVRDNYSKKLLDSINIQSNIIPDPVFSDKKNNKEIFSQNYFVKKLHPKQFHLEDLDSFDLQNKTI
ncbi:MAG: polysaccharide pyruvyl transferase family protein [Patescibacteria group bacterium]